MARAIRSGCLDHVDLVDDEGTPISRDDLNVDASRGDEVDSEAEQDEENE